ncbi:MAG: hypothetical protein IPG96_17930 [Proteobacteria bacterium]|nr:hypothetical protein [Pseudomonadota bacterium]
MSSRSPLQGFNHNVRHGGRVYHVQTEDSGLDHPHLFTHLYYRGLILASARTSYSELAQQPGHEPAVRKLMQEQHKTLMRQLRHGEFDEKIFSLLGAVEATTDADTAGAGAADTDRVAEREVVEASTPAAAATAPELAAGGLASGATDPATLGPPAAAAPGPIEVVIDALPAIPTGATSAGAPPAAVSHAADADVADTQRISAPAAQQRARATSGRAAATSAPPPIAQTPRPAETRARSGRGLEDALEWARGNSAASEIEAEPTLVQRIESHTPTDAAGAPREALRPGAQTQQRLGPEAEAARQRASGSAGPPPTGTTPAVRPPSATHATTPAAPGDPRHPRPSGTYSVPTWARGPSAAPAAPRPAGSGAPPSVDPAVARAASTPQRYTAPSAKSSGRGRRATGSYSPAEAGGAGTSAGAPAAPSSAPAARPVAASGGVYRISTLGGARPSGASAARGGAQSVGAVVARPAVVVDRATPATRAPAAAPASGLSAPAARPAHPRATPAPPPSAVGMVPTKRPTASPPATPSSAAHPRPFGADLISERSLDEVILQYLSEENDGAK